MMEGNTLHQKTCAICNNVFEAIDKKTKYCSTICRSRSGNKKQKNKRDAEYIPLIKNCTVCGESFTAARNLGDKQKYCSLVCKTSAMQSKQSYKDYLKEYNKDYREENKEVLSKLAYEWHDNDYFGGNKKHVLERDNHQCVNCGYAHYLHVHHKDGSGKSEKPNNDMSNLITLCMACHARVHQSEKNGIDYNSITKEMLEESYVRNRTWEGVAKEFGVSEKFIRNMKKREGVKRIPFKSSCLQCQSEFETIHTHERYCSKRCNTTAAVDRNRKRLAIINQGR